MAPRLIVQTTNSSNGSSSTKQNPYCYTFFLLNLFEQYRLFVPKKLFSTFFIENKHEGIRYPCSECEYVEIRAANL